MKTRKSYTKEYNRVNDNNHNPSEWADVTLFGWGVLVAIFLLPIFFIGFLVGLDFCGWLFIGDFIVVNLIGLVTNWIRN